MPDACSIDFSDQPLTRARAIGEPSAELLDRAHAGWERFLVTFEGAPDE
ncbi:MULTISPECIES: hypothetical protein [Streptomyces]|uniref:Uncharacterized protein n=1 Tax=Streptomyces katrae TaxID=68223 RepID=A0ABT7GX32_9ACTN|nr:MULTISPECIES: hypothetical protein [Streptomyces]MDK9497460.1 hypothetical protein [Streptomyces katrae]GLX17864.1 hypothetical protein Slala01_15080 [Streptomyces lavendulae subsp. lavendulae]GLX26208.1 hypothetical protein Slala02_20280 [Streptomyces lavendulae subsp. lavendulae]